MGDEKTGRGADEAMLCGTYVGDNDGTCPQLTCVRAKGHEGLHDNVNGDEKTGRGEAEANDPAHAWARAATAPGGVMAAPGPSSGGSSSSGSGSSSATPGASPSSSAEGAPLSLLDEATLRMELGALRKVDAAARACAFHEPRAPWPRHELLCDLFDALKEADQFTRKAGEP